MKAKKRVFLLFVLILWLFSSVTTYAHNAYFLSVTIDPATFQYVGFVSFEKVGLGEGKHAEKKIDAMFAMSKNWSSIYREYEALKTSTGDQTEALREFYVGNGKTAGTTGMISWENDSAKEECMAFTFPGLHKVVGFGVGIMDANSEDEALANRVVSYPVEGLNSCLSFIRSQCYNGRITSIDTMQILATKICAYASANLNNNAGTTYNINGTSVKFSKATNSTPHSTSGIYLSDYIKVTINGTSKEFCYRCPKGYYTLPSGKTDAMKATSKTPIYLNKLQSAAVADPKYMTWDLIVMQGNYNADVSNVTMSNLEEIINPGALVSAIGSICKWMITGISNAFGLKPYEDYMLIRNNVKSDWVYGMFPESWQPPILLLYTVCLTIAMSLIGFSILKILWKKQLSTVNIGEKIAMQESIKNLIVTLFLFFAFIPIFIFLAGLNSSLVSLFASSITDAALMGLTTSSFASYVSFASIIMSVAELVLKIYFNFFYVVRGVTLAVLIGIAPLAIYSLSLGGKLAGVFSAYLKELISQIFVQSVHAVIAAFFFNALSLSTMTAFEKIVILYSFIPITNFVKTKVFQLTEGPAAGVAGAATSGAASMASGAAKGISGGGKSETDGGGSNMGPSGSGGYGGSGSSGEGILSSAIDRTATTQRSAAIKTGKPIISMSDVPAANQNAPGYRDVYSSMEQSGSDKKHNTSASNEVVLDRHMAGMRKGIKQAAGGLAYTGLAMGMTAIGQNPDRYFEMAGKQFGGSVRTIHQANKESALYSKKGGLRDQQIQAMENAGIEGISNNGLYARYEVNSTNASAQHQAIYDDLKKAGTPDINNNFTPQQDAAKAYYRDNYGIQHIEPHPTDGNRLILDMEMAKMEAQRMNQTDPFEGMKTFKWKDENKS